MSEIERLRRAVAASRENKPFSGTITRVVSGYSKGSEVKHEEVSQKAWKRITENPDDPAHAHLKLFVEMHKAYGKTGPENWIQTPWKTLMGKSESKTLMTAVQSEFTNLINRALIDLGGQGKIVFDKGKRTVRILEQV